MMSNPWQSGFLPLNLPDYAMVILHNSLCMHDINAMKQVCKSWRSSLSNIGYIDSMCAMGCACRHGHLSRLKWLHNLEYKWGRLSCNFAALYGHLDCLKYAQENGCPEN
jgi:hypothetical protein